MILTPGFRKFALTAHVAFSVGWLGAVAAFLVLAIAGLASDDAKTVGGAYVAMNLIGWLVIVPLCFASVLTGLVQALGTPWGLFRHYWIVMKLLIAVLFTLLLLVHMRPTSHLAEMTAETILSSTDLVRIRIQLMADAGVALLGLLVTTILAVYKPRGVTPYGARKQRETREDVEQSRARMPLWVKLLLAAIVIVLVMMKLFIAPHH